MSVIIGIDCEYQRSADAPKNIPVSYQWYGIGPKGEWSGVHYPLRDRKISLVQWIGSAIQTGIAANALTEWPKEIVLAAHFDPAELSMASDFKKQSRRFDLLRSRAWVSLRGPKTIWCNDKSRNPHAVKVQLVDTVLHAPEKFQKLEDLGVLLGIPKVDLPAGAIGRMAEFKNENPSLFEKYAITDARITAAYVQKLIGLMAAEGLAGPLPSTASALSVRIVEKLWSDSKFDGLAFLGRERKRVTKYAHGGKPYTALVDKYVERVDLKSKYAEYAYHGGRNECFAFGPLNIDPADTVTDYDLSGAYTTAMAAIRVPNYDAIEHTKDATRFKAEVLGLARVAWKFPAGTRYPCLFKRDEKGHGLIFLMEGEEWCGAPEIDLALSMGADIKIIEGIIIPWENAKRPLEDFVKFVADKRSRFQKGTLENEWWKLIGNSLYGKLGQGVRPSRIWNSNSD